MTDQETHAGDGLFEPFLDLIRSIFDGFFDRVAQKKKQVPPEGFQRELQDRYDSPQIGVNIRSTRVLRERNGRYPEWMVARFLSEVLDRAGYNYDITWGYEDSMDPPSEQSICGEDSAFGWWAAQVNRRNVPVAPDSNILITDAESGGCGIVGGNVCTVPGRHLDHHERYRESGTSMFDNNVHGALHEFAHNMHIDHDEDKETPGNQTTGIGWNEGGRWHQTPGYGVPDEDLPTTNFCGEPIPQKGSDEIEYHHYFTECTVHRFEPYDQKT